MNKRKFLIISIIIVLISSYLSIKLVSKKLTPGMIRYATVEAKRLTTTIINTSIHEVIGDTKTDQNIFNLIKNDQNEIEIIDFNTKIVNELLKDITENVQEKIIKLEEGKIKDFEVSESLKGKNFPHIKRGVVCETSSGSIFDNDLLANFGPLIPVKLTFVGRVLASIQTNIQTYGMNNAYIEVNVLVSITEKLILPAASKEVVIKKSIPIAMKVIEGKIPVYYNGNIEQSSPNYSLPLS